ncbi:MAG: hypothetical protein ABI647_02935 [Gemmatimonadota bacterium]
MPRSSGSVKTAPAPQEITIKTMDFAFELPAKVRPGLTTIHLLNGGTELHHVWLLKLGQGKTLADLLAALKPETPFPAWATSIGGPNAPGPGGEFSATLELTPGRYAVICVIPSADGKPHVMKGMSKSFEVAGRPVAAVSAPADIQVNLKDYAFGLSKPLTAGRHVLRFTNSAGQVHEAFIARLAPGKRATDLLAWIEKPQGPPPGQPLGGITGINPGQSISITEDFEPGTYAFFCFVPDAKDGQPHLAHGMMQEYEISPVVLSSRSK